jgi:hypothetical protein
MTEEGLCAASAWLRAILFGQRWAFLGWQMPLVFNLGQVRRHL